MLTAQFLINILLQLRVQTQEVAPPTFMLSLPTSNNIIMTISHRPMHRPTCSRESLIGTLPQMIIDGVMSVIKTVTTPVIFRTSLHTLCIV